ncbi:nonstructural protein [Microvirus mar30]|uniref:Nonstructural protein n=1 Tax=Microvirus mar30 TaxID=2851164 RepID=A0A8F5MKL3_9VIRU|nr:nonstructural protein [Microvirus mar30]
MKYNLYAIRDFKTTFMSPIIEQSNASAIRNFNHAYLNKDSVMHTHPEDFALYLIGTYNAETGEIIPCTVELIVSASDFTKGE